jgi:hypothetical protein
VRSRIGGGVEKWTPIEYRKKCEERGWSVDEAKQRIYSEER